jgi:D-methionine transport system ATP-binding protein
MTAAPPPRPCGSPRSGAPSIVNLKPGEKILRLKYLEQSASEALISVVSRKFNIDANIIFGNIEVIQNASLGGLVVIASGKEEDIQSAVQYLLDKKVEVEVIDNGRFD